MVELADLFVLQTPEHLKTPTAEEAFNPDGLVQRSIRLLKDTFPDLEVGNLTTCWHLLFLLGVNVGTAAQSSSTVAVVYLHS